MGILNALNEKRNLKGGYENFIEQSRKRFGDRYDFPNIVEEFVNQHSIVTIKCNRCGNIFPKRAGDHLTSSKGGCKICKKEEMVYSYEYLNDHNPLNLNIKPFTVGKFKGEKIKVICDIHGEYEIYVSTFLKGRGFCKKCIGAEIQRKKNEDFKKRLPLLIKEMYGDDIVPDMSTFVNSSTDMFFICTECGHTTKHKPNNILHKKLTHVCPNCDDFVRKMDTEIFIERATKKHGDKYDYSEVEFVGYDANVRIICHKLDEFGEEHGVFEQSPHSHLHGTNCPKCSNKFGSRERFIKLANLKYHGCYDYSSVVYRGATRGVKIICPEHGRFTLTPNQHLTGHKCPWCTKSSLEIEIKGLLEENKIKYINNHTFDWLVYSDKMRLDFYLPEYNIAIECQGLQHFEPVNFFGGEKGFKINLERDNLKCKLCNEHGIKILYYSNLGIIYPYEVFEDKGKLLEEIKKNV